MHKKGYFWPIPHSERKGNETEDRGVSCYLDCLQSASMELSWRLKTPSDRRKRVT